MYRFAESLIKTAISAAKPFEFDTRRPRSFALSAVTLRSMQAEARSHRSPVIAFDTITHPKFI
jgi:hypothetical protein